MGYYDLSDEKAKELGVDYDFCSCLEYNPQPFSLDDVSKVLAVVNGENDGADWHWIISLKDGRFANLTGGCDYTGWDCQSWASCAFFDNPTDASKHGEADEEIKIELLRQIETVKDKTWRDKKDVEFGLRNE